jgi:prepilin-type N-terminal cleavage/methylation domain-containing protein
MALAKSRFSDASGFTLIEVLVSSVVFITGVVALAQLFVISTMTNRAARSTTSTVVLAQQKMEQLRGLAWGFDVLGLPLTDTTTNISIVPAGPGGSGLSPSPAGSLSQNITGFVDYLDEYGNWIGNGGGTPPPAAIFIRRWSIEPLPTNPNNTLILQVLVTRFRQRGAADAATNVGRLPEEARLVSVKTRKTI